MPWRGHQRGGHGVVGGERVAGAQADVGATRLERDRQVGGLAGDVQAGAEAQARERLLALEALADQPQHRHLQRGPLDEPLALVGQREVGDVVFGAGRWWSFVVSVRR